MNRDTVAVLAFMEAMIASGPYGRQLTGSLFPEHREKPCSICDKCRFDVKGLENHCRSSHKTLFRGTEIVVQQCDGFEGKEDCP